MECVICINNKDKSEFISLWKCAHKFCKTCASGWNKTCPCCRSNRSINFNGISHLDLNFMINNYNHVPEESRSVYLHKWKVRLCIENNHNINLLHTYGVMGVCIECTICECFNLMH